MADPGTLPSLRELEAFRATVEAGSATGAARRLAISQPAVSRALAQLEGRLDVVLFRREEGRLRPTDEALALNEELAVVFEGLDNVARRSFAGRRARAGRLRIAASTSFSIGVIDRQVARFVETHPGVRIHLETCPSEDAARLVSADQADLAVTGFGAKHPGVRSVTLRETDAVCAMPKGHRLVGRRSVRVQDLNGERFVAYSKRLPVRVELDRLFDKAGVERDVVAETATAISACQLVAAGIGVAVVNPFPVPPWLMNDIVFVPFVPAFRYVVSALLPTTRPPSRLARIFVADLREWAAGAVDPAPVRR